MPERPLTPPIDDTPRHDAIERLADVVDQLDATLRQLQQQLASTTHAPAQRDFGADGRSQSTARQEPRGHASLPAVTPVGDRGVASMLDAAERSADALESIQRDGLKLRDEPKSVYSD